MAMRENLRRSHCARREVVAKDRTPQVLAERIGVFGILRSNRFLPKAAPFGDMLRSRSVLGAISHLCEEFDEPTSPGPVVQVLIAQSSGLLHVQFFVENVSFPLAQHLLGGSRPWPCSL